MITTLDFVTGEIKKLKYTYVPSIGNRDDSSAVFCNFQESRLGQIKVLERGIAPAAVVIGKRIVRRAEVGGSDGNGTA